PAKAEGTAMNGRPVDWRRLAADPRSSSRNRRLDFVKTSGRGQGKDVRAGRLLTGLWIWLAIFSATAMPYALRMPGRLGLTTSAVAGICAAVLMWSVVMHFGERRLRRIGRNKRVASLRGSAIVQVIVTLGLSMTPSCLGL